MKKTLFSLAMLCFVLGQLTPIAYAMDADSYHSPYFGTVVALLPPIMAITLALLTKEVFSSLFAGIFLGGLLYSGFQLEGTVLHVFETGLIGALADGYNMGILVFLVMLGAMVCLINKAGGSAAFGRWATKNIKSPVGAQLASIGLGALIFVDDYFNCLTVGSVMRPVTDKHNISRSKLAYLIDATAAPICIIAPISSWAAAVASYVEDGQGLSVFIQAIPYNFYAFFTLVMMITLVLTKTSFGPMTGFELAAREGDLFNGKNPYANQNRVDDKGREGEVLDLIVPIVALIGFCVVGMVYSGGFFDGVGFVTAFSDSDASVGLMLGSSFALIFTLLFYLVRKSLSLHEMMECIPEGFRAMVPAIMILSLAWTLKIISDSLGLREFVAGFVAMYGQNVQALLPAIVFLVACFLAFASGTSWGTFGILIPITLDIFPLDNPLGIICISACMAGAVCGDHCSPISDTTIMASAGAQCDLVNHVSTQLPYCLATACITTVAYLMAGLLAVAGFSGLIMLPVGMVATVGFVFYVKKYGLKLPQKAKIAL